MAVKTKLTNIGTIQFGDGNPTTNDDTGTILLDTLTAVTFQTQGTGGNAQVCSVFNGELGAGSSSASAVLEVNTPTGAILISRMTTVQRDALTDPKSGMIIYNTTTNQFQFRQNNTWIVYGNVSGPSNSISGNIAIWDNTTGTLLSDKSIAANSLVTGVVLAKGLSIKDQKLDIDWVSSVNASKILLTKSLEIPVNSGYFTQYMDNYSVLSSAGVSKGTISTSVYVSIVTEQAIISKLGFYAMSSRNVKNIIEPNDQIDNELLTLFKDISIKKYKYKDQLQKGNGSYYGVIAEEVAEVMPHIVIDKKEFIPNIMTKGIIEYFDNKVRVNFDHDLTEFLQGKFEKKELQIFGKKSFEFKILEVTSDYIDLELLEDKPENLEEVFVYGTKESCPSVSKERLFEMNIAVTQMLLNRIETLEKRLGVDYD